MKTWAVIFAAILPFVALTACDPSLEAQKSWEDQMTQLEGRTVPPGDRVARQWGPVKKGNNLTANWEFQTVWSAAKYTTWVLDKLSTDFKQKGTGLEFARFMDGDSQTVSIKTALEKGRLHVWVSWSSFPD